MKFIVVVLGGMLLAGCSTPSDLKKNPPSISASSKKSPKQYALCVLPKWQESRSASTMSETENGYRLIVATDISADEVLEVTSVGSGSKVSLYQRMPWAKMVGRGAIEDAVRDCL